MNKKTYTILAAAVLLIASAVYASVLNCELSDKFVRLHVIANSNSEEDQRIKLEIRDCIISEIKAERLTDKEAVIKGIPELDKAARRRLEELGAGYSLVTVRASSDFPLKEYEDIRLPSGKYDSIRIILGEGNGKNWWCVAYPPLCFTEDTLGELSEEGKDSLKTELSEESYRMITQDGIEIEYKFKIAELLERVRRFVDEKRG